MSKSHLFTNQSYERLTGLAYLPRWLAGTACYIAFGLGGFMLGMTLFLMSLFNFHDTQYNQARGQRMVSWVFRRFVAMLTWAGVINVSQSKIQQLKQAKGCVIIANHPTLVDVVVLISLMPNVSCVVKQSLWRNPFIRSVLSGAGYIPNRGGELLISDCHAVLNQGTNLIVFPEGTRTVKGHIINPFNRGAANIAIRSHANITPVLLHTDVAGLTKQQAWYQIPRQTINMNVEVGKPFTIKTQDSVSETKLARQLTRELENYYRANLSVPAIN